MEIQPVVPAEFQYWPDTKVQTVILHEQILRIHPTAAPQHEQPIEFNIPKQAGWCIDLNQSKVEIHCKIVKEDGSAVGTDGVSVANNALHTMFEHMQLDIGGKTVTQPDHMYPYRAYFETIMNYSEPVLKTRGVLEGFAKDTAGKLEDFDPAGANDGVKTRAKWFAASKEVVLIGRPRLDLFHQDRPIPQMCDVRLRVLPNKDTIIVKSKAPAKDVAQNKYKLMITKAFFQVRVKELSWPLLETLETMVNEMPTPQNRHRAGPFRFPHTATGVKTINIAKGTTSESWEDIFHGKVPNMVLIALVKAEDRAGGYQANPFNFHHFDVSMIKLIVNGRTEPRDGLEPQFTAGNYLSVYNHNLEVMRQDLGDRIVWYTPEDFAGGTTVYLFKLNSSQEDVHGTGDVGTVRLELKFAVATPASIDIILLDKQPALLQLDRNRTAMMS